MYDNAMLEYGSELGSPDARHSSSRGASSSGGPSDGGPLLPAGNFDRRHAGARTSQCSPPVKVFIGKWSPLRKLSGVSS